MIAKPRTLTHARLKQVLHYDDHTGLFRRKSTGKFVGCNRGDGHLTVNIDKEKHWLHRLAWFYMYEKWPEHAIDHINRIASDNRIKNLRDVPTAINAQNMLKQNKNGMPFGVQYVPGKVKPYRSRIKTAGVVTDLGAFDTADDAHAAYMAAKLQHHSLMKRRKSEALPKPRRVAKHVDLGFLDNRGAFMLGEEAYEVAKAAGQIVNHDECGYGENGWILFSEALLSPTPTKDE